MLLVPVWRPGCVPDADVRRNAAPVLGPVECGWPGGGAGSIVRPTARLLPTASAATIPGVLGDDELRRERAYLDAAYDRVLAMRGAAEDMAGTARLTETRNAQAMFERDSAIA